MGLTHIAYNVGGFAERPDDLLLDEIFLICLWGSLAQELSQAGEASFYWLPPASCVGSLARMRALHIYNYSASQSGKGIDGFLRMCCQRIV